MFIHHMSKSNQSSRYCRLGCVFFCLLVSFSSAVVAQTSQSSLLDSLDNLGEGASLAEPAQALTLEAAISLALERNPTLAAARREIEAADAQILQGSLRPNPEFVYLAEDTRSISKTTTAQLDVPVETGGKRGARVEAAVRNKNVAVSELTARQLKIRASTIAAFFDVLAAQELTALARETLTLAMRASDIAGKRVSAGKISPVEEIKARVAEAGVRLSLTQAESDLRNARRRLSAQWGNPSPRFNEVVGEVDRIPELLTREKIQSRLMLSPVLERAQQELERRKSLVAVEQSKTLPDVTFSIGMKRREDVTRDQVLVGLTVPLPVFNRNQGNLLEKSSPIITDFTTICEQLQDHELVCGSANKLFKNHGIIIQTNCNYTHVEKMLDDKIVILDILIILFFNIPFLILSFTFFSLFIYTKRL